MNAKNKGKEKEDKMMIYLGHSWNLDSFCHFFIFGIGNI
jgi:hypothetical protein